MMQRATIEVAYVNPPKEGGKVGSVKTKDGVYYRVFANQLGNFAPGNTYTVDYEAGEWQGKPQFTIKAVQSPTVPAAAYGAQPSLPTATTQRVNGNGAYRETSQRDAERMFVCKLLGDFITAGHIQPNATDVKQAVDTLRAVWRGTFGQDQ